MKGINQGKSKRKMRHFRAQCVGSKGVMEIIRRDAGTSFGQQALLLALSDSSS